MKAANGSEIGERGPGLVVHGVETNSVEALQMKALLGGAVEEAVESPRRASNCLRDGAWSAFRACGRS